MTFDKQSDEQAAVATERVGGGQRKGSRMVREGEQDGGEGLVIVVHDNSAR
jgi:hypothetical protein